MKKIFTPNRRQFLKSASAAALFTLGVPSVLRAQAQAAKKRLILVTCNGGWDVSFHLDPKTSSAVIDAPAGNILSVGDLEYFSANAANGVVDTFFSIHNDVASSVRGISVRSLSHDVCIRRMLTGSPSEEAPDFGVITAANHGPDLPSPYLTLGAVSFPGNLEGASVRMGTSNQLALAHRYDEFAPDLAPMFPTASEQSIIDQYLVDEGTRFKQARGQFGKNARKTTDFVSSISRVQGLAEHKASLGAPFSIALELDQQFQDALTMLEDNVAWAVNVSTGFVWDHHDPAQAPTGTYDGAQGLRNQTLWPALTALIGELKTRPGLTPGSKMIDDTMVVVVSEMTRTPKKNAAGGKDHWPYTSALVVGQGINAGRSLGATDDTLTSLRINLDTGAADDNGVVFESGHFASTILTLCGVNPSTYMPEPPLAALIA